MSDQRTENKPDRQRFEKLPVIFHFQPTSYEVVTPDRLGEWETLMRERVGFVGKLAEGDIATRAARRLLPSISFCGEVGGGAWGEACDCDQV